MPSTLYCESAPILTRTLLHQFSPVLIFSVHHLLFLFDESTFKADGESRSGNEFWSATTQAITLSLWLLFEGGEWSPLLFYKNHFGVSPIFQVCFCKTKGVMRACSPASPYTKVSSWLLPDTYLQEERAL
jgi:hypothetical protein